MHTVNHRQSQSAPTYRQALRQAMNLFLMAPFFRRPANTPGGAGICLG